MSPTMGPIASTGAASLPCRTRTSASCAAPPRIGRTLNGTGKDCHQGSRASLVQGPHGSPMPRGHSRARYPRELRTKRFGALLATPGGLSGHQVVQRTWGARTLVRSRSGLVAGAVPEGLVVEG